MAKSSKSLTALKVENEKPRAARVEIPDGDMSLYLVVQPSGAKSWAYRYRFDGKPKKHTLGSYPQISLANARKLVNAAARTVAEGRDPAEEKRAAKAPSDIPETIDDLAKRFILLHAKKKTRPRSCEETARILGLEDNPDEPATLRLTKSRGYVLSQWSRRRIDSIKKRDVQALVDDIADRHAVHANRVLAAVRKMFNWAAEKDLVEASPCAGVKAPSEETSRDRVLTDSELRAVVRASGKLGGPFDAFVAMLILTLQRRNEVSGMRWSEIDLTEGTWTIPAARTKNKTVHAVPLSKAAMAVLQALQPLPRIIGDSDLVFTTTGTTAVSGFSKTKRNLDDLIALELGEPVASWRFHDLRRTGASTMARLGIQLPTIEKVLNHVSGSFGGIVGVYQRHSYAAEKRAALEAWAAFIDRLDGGAADNVVHFQANRGVVAKEQQSR